MPVRPFRQRTIRAGALLLSFVLVLLVYSLRLVQLQVGQYDQWRQRSENNHQSKRILDMKRGTIYDRNGAELAIAVEYYSVFLYPREIKSLPDTAALLSTVLPMTRQEILDKAGKRKGYFPIFRNLERKPATRIMDLKIPGVHLEETFRRIYPQNKLASNLIGFCGTDGHGLEGLELSFDRSMRGYPGLAVQEDVMMDGGPRRLRVVQPPAGGNNLYLTLDSFVQHLLEGELAKLVKQYDPIDATAIVMDPHTGEVLGMACLPNYDLNDFAGSKPEAHRNRSVVDMFEPGSCMKIFAVAAGLTAGKIDGDSRFYCRGYSEVYGRRIKCHGAHGLVDLPKAIAESCNSAMIQIGQLVESRHLYRMYRELGFGEPTGIDVPAESQGLLRAPSKWSGLTGPSLSIGQEIAITGIQLVTAYSTIANGGYLMRPRIIKRMVSQKGDLDLEIKPEIRKTVLPPQIASYLRRLLLGVVEGGTGDLAALPNYTICGKTSTAQKANPRGGYYMDKVVTSFVGFAPATNPKIVLLVAANEPKGDEKTLYGGKVAAPVFAAIADRLLKHLKVPPDKAPPTAVTASSPISTDAGGASGATTQMLSPLVLDPLLKDVPMPNRPPDQAASGSVPDFRGLPLRQVASYAAGLPIQVILQGNGIAVEQHPPPGFPLAKASQIVVTFSAHPRN